MKLRIESRHLTIALLLSAALLALAIMTGLGRHASMPLPQPKPDKTGVGALSLRQEFTLPPLEQTYTEVLERPLFVPTRRLPPPAPVDAPQSAMRKGQFILLGVILTKDTKIAMLREIANNKVWRVEQGKEINGMLLEKLESDKITLKQGDDREEVVLKIKPMQSPPQPAATSNPNVPAQADAPAAASGSSAMEQLIAQRRAAHGLPP